MVGRQAAGSCEDTSQWRSRFPAARNEEGYLQMLHLYGGLHSFRPESRGMTRKCADMMGVMRTCIYCWHQRRTNFIKSSADQCSNNEKCLGIYVGRARKQRCRCGLVTN